MEKLDMKELVAINEQTFGDELRQAVDARDLHVYLDVKRDFTSWVKERIDKFGFVDGVDYLLTKIGEQHDSGLKYRSVYYLTLDVAKEFAMLHNNEKGREVRRYFIECEKKLKLVSSKPMPAVLEVSTEMLGLAKLFGLEGNQALLAADKATFKTIGVSPLKLLEMPLVADERILTPTEIGKLLGGLNPRRVNNQLVLEGYQYKNEAGIWTITDKGKPYAVLLDVGKSRSDGTPVQQIKWKESIINNLDKEAA
jgi:phage anti-repressor protein